VTDRASRRPRRADLSAHRYLPVSLEELKFFFQTGAEQVLGSDAHQRLRG